jgi:hypothetical protein
LEKKAGLDKQIAELGAKGVELQKRLDSRAGRIGNLVDKDCYDSLTEVSFVPGFRWDSDVWACGERGGEEGETRAG